MEGVIPVELWIEIAKGTFTVLGIWITVSHSSKKSVKELEQKVDKLIKDNEEQHTDILRLTIFEDNLPISERIIAGDRYLRKGGNGDTKKYYQQMLKEHTK